MILKGDFFRYGQLVAHATQDPTARSWEHVAHCRLELLERQDERLDQPTRRLKQLEQQMTQAAGPAGRCDRRRAAWARV